MSSTSPIVAIPLKSQLVAKPLGAPRGIVRWDLAAKGNLSPRDRYYIGGDDVVFHKTNCREHERIELVPSESYWHYNVWYLEGRHPRFSVQLALLDDAKQQYWEAVRLLGDPVVRKAVRECRGKRDFLRRVSSVLNVPLYHQRRRYRVTAEFKRKFKTEAFTAEDFLSTRNQELRRLMLRRGPPLDQILKKMTLIATDEEGELYEEAGQRYLHVKCPSTGARYLLAVPRSQWLDNGKVINLNTPAAARRWTFNVPADAKFVAEA